MTDELVKNVNELVQSNDKLYFLGDWTFGGKDKVKLLRDRINCSNIYLTFGNHDEHIRKDESLQKLFGWCKDVSFIKEQGESFWLSHYAHIVWPWSHKGVIHCFGHSHHTLPNRLVPNGALDVGIDKTFKPFHIDEVIKLAKENKYIPQDHHGQR